MRIYVGYKFRHTEDKPKLISELKLLGQKIESLGHQTFILGRDKQNWQEHKVPQYSNIKNIIAEMERVDLFFAYVTSDICSTGLAFEIIASKILGKPFILAVKSDVKAKQLRKCGKKVIGFENFDDLLGKLPKELSNL